VIDLHCHLLPGADDGAVTLADSMAMARISCSDGIRITACTPHIFPTVYDNKGPNIIAAVEVLQEALAMANVQLRLVAGADVHVSPNLLAGLTSGDILSINRSRYVLIEVPHHVPLPQLEDQFFRLHAAGYIGILTHPERLSWINTYYDLIKRLVHNGAWLQITAGSLTGRFGRHPRYWAERLLDEGLCHVLATDAHNVSSRPPCLSEGRIAAANRLGEAEATNLVCVRPQGILDDVSPTDLPVCPAASQQEIVEPRWKRLLRIGQRTNE